MTAMLLDPEFLSILVCPACRRPLAQPAEDRLRCQGCGRQYPVRTGIPILLLDEAILPEGAPEEPGEPPNA